MECPSFLQLGQMFAHGGREAGRAMVWISSEELELAGVEGRGTRGTCGRMGNIAGKATWSEFLDA
jgi:hypothetical protein